MYSLFVFLAVAVAVLLAFIVLIQESKGGGLASSFASSNQIMGVRKTTDFIEKATWTLAALLVVFSVLAIFSMPSQERQSIMTESPVPATQTVPQGAGAAATGEAAGPAAQAPAAPAQ